MKFKQPSLAQSYCCCNTEFTTTSATTTDRTVLSHLTGTKTLKLVKKKHCWTIVDRTQSGTRQYNRDMPQIDSNQPWHERRNLLAVLNQLNT